MPQPLADKVRPTNLGEFIGQDHLVNKDKPVRRMLESGNLHSLLLWGPPGCGKTTLARIIAKDAKRDFYYLSAVSAGKDDIRKIVSPLSGNSSQPRLAQSSPILFLDEIHRFNKAQQDFLLPFVEDGTIIFIGATTENPSFEIISPLLSRCQVFVLKEHTDADVAKIVQRGLKELRLKTKPSKSALDLLGSFANGDGRQALNLLETTVKLYGKVTINSLKESLQSKHLRYDKKAEEHYNTISAFIKSMRASDPNAALYYLARMVDSGEDPKFIARRMVIFASEDVGMAQPTALVVANEVFRSVEIIGYPECAINLAHGVVYLATAKKDRGAYDGLRSAQEDVKKYGNLPIPMSLRNAPTKLMKNLGYGKGYQKYSKESLLPDKLKGEKYV